MTRVHDCLNTENKLLASWFHHNKYNILLHSFDSKEDKSMKRRTSWEPLDHEVSTSAAQPLYQQLLHLFHYNHKVRLDLLHHCTLPLLTRTTYKLLFLKSSWFCFLEDKAYVIRLLTLRDLNALHKGHEYLWQCGSIYIPWPRYELCYHMHLHCRKLQGEAAGKGARTQRKEITFSWQQAKGRFGARAQAPSPDL